MKKVCVIGLMMAMATAAFAGNGQVGSVGREVKLTASTMIECTIDTDSIFDDKNGKLWINDGEIDLYENGESKPTQTLPVNCSYQGNAFGCKVNGGKMLIYSRDISKTVYQRADANMGTVLGAFLGMPRPHADVFQAFMKTQGWFGEKVTKLACSAF